VDLWLVRDVSPWLVGAALILGLPSLMLCVDAMFHRRMPHARLYQHNDVTGVIVSVVGVAYAIVIGLCVVSLWEGYTSAKDTVRDEAASLTALVPNSIVFDAQVQGTVIAEIIQYETDLVDDWQTRLEEGSDRERTADLDRLAGFVGDLRPTTDAQRAFLPDALQRIGRAEQFHHDNDAEADDQRVSGVMWFGVLTSTTAILGMLLFFGLPDTAVRRALLILASAVIATNLFLIIEMSYPYYGSFAVRPDAYQHVIEDLRKGR
jgi:hypothetical protein